MFTAWGWGLGGLGFQVGEFKRGEHLGLRVLGSGGGVRLQRRGWLGWCPHTANSKQSKIGLLLWASYICTIYLYPKQPSIRLQNPKQPK